MQHKYSFIFLTVFMLIGGCAAPSMYYWGSYEDNIYKMYAKPDKATAERQVEILEAEIEKVRSSGKPLPPGFRAHLGFLYYQLGNSQAARAQFEMEKEVFPESAVLMDRFCEKL